MVFLEQVLVGGNRSGPRGWGGQRPPGGRASPASGRAALAPGAAALTPRAPGLPRGAAWLLVLHAALCHCPFVLEMLAEASTLREVLLRSV